MQSQATPPHPESFTDHRYGGHGLDGYGGVPRTNAATNLRPPTVSYCPSSMHGGHDVLLGEPHLFCLQPGPGPTGYFSSRSYGNVFLGHNPIYVPQSPQYLQPMPHGMRASHVNMPTQPQASRVMSPPFGPSGASEERVFDPRDFSMPATPRVSARRISSCSCAETNHSGSVGHSHQTVIPPADINTRRRSSGGPAIYPSSEGRVHGIIEEVNSLVESPLPMDEPLPPVTENNANKTPPPSESATPRQQPLSSQGCQTSPSISAFPSLSTGLSGTHADEGQPKQPPNSRASTTNTQSSGSSSMRRTGSRSRKSSYDVRFAEYSSQLSVVEETSDNVDDLAAGGSRRAKEPLSPGNVTSGDGDGSKTSPRSKDRHDVSPGGDAAATASRCVRELEHRLRWLAWRAKLPENIEVKRTILKKSKLVSFSLAETEEDRGTGTVMRELERLHMEADTLELPPGSSHLAKRLGKVKRNIAAGRASFMELFVFGVYTLLRYEDSRRSQLEELYERQQEINSMMGIMIFTANDHEFNPPTEEFVSSDSSILRDFRNDLKELSTALQDLSTPGCSDIEERRKEIIELVEDDLKQNAACLQRLRVRAGKSNLHNLNPQA
ncbi:hypothetical protein BXZ70DRAFT_706231 [Cristinia sonorae]|uniref:Uncharacterized protein n=1 Tax=Cristinia sonorae TaxID=1940300 RepID=A0A8K0UD09_9AGAR|nr:hypothetical protein BXZ70DRAFT_706231 [Cristinia sonorae]